MWIELSHTEGIRSIDVELYLVDTWDTKCPPRCSSAVLDRRFARSDGELSFSDLDHQWYGTIGYPVENIAG